MQHAPLRLASLCSALALFTLATPADESPEAAAAAELLSNADFSEWEDGALKDWTLSIGSGAEWSIVVPERVEGAEAEATWVRLPDPGADYAVLAQPLPPERIRPGNTMRFAARVKAERAFQLHLIVAFDRRSGPQKVREHHRGGGDWQEIEWYFEVPTDAVPDSFRLQLLRPPGRPGEVLIDRASVRFAQDW